jgi:hypothetical protein
MRWALGTGAAGWLYVRNVGEAEARQVQGITSTGGALPDVLTRRPPGSRTSRRPRDLPKRPGDSKAAGHRRYAADGRAAHRDPDLARDPRRGRQLGRTQHADVGPAEGIMQVSATAAPPSSSSRRATAKRSAARRSCLVEHPFSHRHDGAGRESMGHRRDRRAGARLGRAKRRLARRPRCPLLPTGHILFAQGSTLFALPFDLGRRAATGGQTPVVEGLPTSGDPIASDTAQFAVSETGSLVYLTGGATPATGNRKPAAATDADWVGPKR